MNPDLVRSTVAQALAEDIGSGDITGGGFTDLAATGRVVAEEDVVVAGLEVAREVFHQVDPKVVFETAVADGDAVADGGVLFTVAGTGAALLAAERVALNFIQRLTGIATLTRRYVARVEGTGCAIADTRKTTPHLRELEKYAVRMGGGKNHRMGLFDAVLIKDNHIELAGSMENAVARARALAGEGKKIEVETSNLAEVEQALALSADIIMLDNFDLPGMKKAVALIAGRALVEASGGVNLDSVRPIAETGVDIISVGRLTHSAPAAELSMDIFPA
ncbi:MAG: carboxylating nicotinate-nucleotide diphosphorylase [Leptospirillia bacterium]